MPVQLVAWAAFYFAAGIAALVFLVGPDISLALRVADAPECAEATEPDCVYREPGVVTQEDQSTSRSPITRTNRVDFYEYRVSATSDDAYLSTMTVRTGPETRLQVEEPVTVEYYDGSVVGITGADGEERPAGSLQLVGSIGLIFIPIWLLISAGLASLAQLGAKLRASHAGPHQSTRQTRLSRPAFATLIGSGIAGLVGGGMSNTASSSPVTVLSTAFLVTLPLSIIFVTILWKFMPQPGAPTKVIRG